ALPAHTPPRTPRPSPWTPRRTGSHPIRPPRSRGRRPAHGICDHPAVLDHRDLHAGLRARRHHLPDRRLDPRSCPFLVHTASLDLTTRPDSTWPPDRPANRRPSTMERWTKRSRDTSTRLRPSTVRCSTGCTG